MKFIEYIISFNCEKFKIHSDIQHKYSGSVTYPGIKDGWITYELSTPFEYTGGNLAVCVYDNTGSWVNASSFYTYETGASPRSLYKAQDGAAFTFDNIYSYQGRERRFGKTSEQI